MKKLTAILIGAGSRGMSYSKLMKNNDLFDIVAVAEPITSRRERIRLEHSVPEDRCYTDWKPLVALGKIADIAIVCTMDRDHFAPAMACIDLGYDLLLEKPISSKLEDIAPVVEAAERLGRNVFICHVLRYTPFYREVKSLLDQGVVGRVMNIEASEHVGYYHIAHSYVRGNWHKEADSSPMILAKCCHDMDILLWLTGKKCLSVNSFGSLEYFKAENCPEGATERCMDGCTVEDCPFHAPKFYLSRIPGWPANVLNPDPNEDNIMEALRTTDYGKCVFKMDNDVVDHQTVNMLLEDGITVTFTMSGFNNVQTRKIRIAGTEGEIWGDFEEKKLYWQRYNQEVHAIDIAAKMTVTSGHGGGDTGLVKDILDLYSGVEFDTSSITTIQRSAESHYVAFAAEQSRRAGGELVKMDEFMKNQA